MATAGRARLARRLAVGVAAAGVFATTTVRAQEPAEIEEIVVTSRRAAEDLQTVPIAVTAITGTALEEKHIVESSDLQFKVPTLKISPNSIAGTAQPYFSIRGLSSQSLSDSAVVSYFSEVPLITTRAAVANLYDLERIEVLKGPQGTLFGKNTTGGAILFVPVKPADEWGGFVEAQYGSYDDIEVTYSLNAPLLDSLKVRVSGQTIRRDGLQPNESGPELDTRHRDSFRGSLVWTPIEWFENYTIVDYQRMDEQMLGSITEKIGVCPQSQFRCVYDALGVDLQGQLDAQNARGKHATANTGGDGNPNEGWLGGATNITTVPIELLGGVTAKNIVAYRQETYEFENDADGLPAGILAFDNENDHHQLTEELQFSGETFGDRLDWRFGGYYSNAKLFTDQIVNILREVPPVVVESLGILPFRFTHDRAISRALFGQVGYDLSALVEGLKLNAGYRHTWDRREERAVGVPNTLGSCLGPGEMDPNRDGDGNPCTRSLDPVEFSEDSYTVGLDWQATPEALVYVTSRRGYKAGGLQGFNNHTVPYEPEFLTDVELGLKADLRVFDVPIRTNFAAYQGAYTDIQVVRTFNNNLGLPAQVIQNAAEATMKGLEFEAQLIPFSGLDLGGFFSYTKGVYKEYFDDTSGADLSGTLFAGVPRRTAGFNARYTLPFGEPFRDVFVAADYYYRSELTGTQIGTDYPNLDPLELWNLQAGWRNVAGSHFDLGFFVKNLLDEDYRTGGFDGTTTIIYASSYYGEQRTIGGSIRYSF